MAGRSSKAKNKGKVVPPKSSPNERKVETETVQDNSLEQGDSVLTAENNESQDSVDSKHNVKTEEEGTVASVAAAGTAAAAGAAEENGTIDHPTSPDKQANGELQLYAVPVKGPCGEKLELQINPTDSVMDIRQFLLDAPETCFYTCYHLFLKMKDGTRHQLADYSEIGEVGDITTGGCSIEMKTALYDDRSVRAHVRRVRDLVATTNLHTSLSTKLAMEFEASHKAHGGEKNKEVPEFEGLGFMENDESLLENLIVSPSSQEVKCIESIAFSSFNPPPGYRRLVGDLIYLDVLTLEGHSYCVTAHTQGFFVNASTANILETKPAKSSHESSSLVGLLRKVSERFRKGFHVLLEKKLSAHPFENVPTWLPLNPWLEVYPPPVHRRDSSRSEDAISLPYGIDPIGMLRDWNEELQSCREFPRQTLQDRILRDRALYKVSCDFVDAAVKGAQGVIHKCIPPINPTDPERFHMYVHNNIFFSFAVDADLAQMQQHFEQRSKEYLNGVLRKAEGIESCISTEKNLPEKDTSSSCALPTDNLEGKDKLEVNSGLSDEAVNHSCHAELDVSSAEKVDPEISDNEQATYASANNDLKGTKAYNNADVAGLYTLAMAIVDYRGHRVVAQSIIPGILQGDKSDSLLYGSVDNGKKISWNEKFHEKVLEAAKVLHIKEHEVIDESGNKIRIAAPVECKGIVGSDDRHYLLDLMRTTPRDANFIGPGTRYYVLRPELITAFCQFEGEERLKQNTSIVSGKSTSTNEEQTNVVLNPNVLTDFKIAGDNEEVSKDEALVRKVGEYLVDVVIPKFVKDLRSLEVSPMDGQTLTEALHAHGINIRYIGKVANMTKSLPHIWDLCVIEMIVRAAKHILKGVLRETKDHDIGGAVSHFFNCFLGHDTHAILNASVVGTALAGDKPRKKGKGVNSKKIGIQAQSESDSTICSSLATSTKDLKKHSNAKSGFNPSYLIITSELVWIDIKEYAKFKYQFDLPEDARSKVKMSTFRNLCQKIGITIAARKYDLTDEIPFKVSDILDMHAVVKHSAPVCSDARDLIDAGKLQLAEGKLHEAFGLFNEAFLILQQVSGPMHREVANCCRYLAMVLYHAGDMQGAIMQQHKELIINERCLGLDHPDTAHSYGNMALFYHGLNQTELALKHMARTLLLLDVSCGPNHPDVAATFINIAMMYQDIGRMNIALRYLQEALKKNECLLGHDHIQTAVCYHALAIAFNCMGAYKLSVQHEKSTYNVLAKQLGEDDARTQDSANWLKTFQLREAQANAQKQKGHVGDVDATQKALDALKARPALLQAIQASGVPLQSTSQTTVNKAAAAAALMGDMLPRGRGIDERGARAAAEIRRRAVAKGLNVRSKPATAQASSPLTDILSLINAGAGSKVPPTQRDSAVTTSTEDATENSQVDSEAKQELANGSSESNSSNKTDDKAPLGLGTGLDTKKQKARAKAT